MEVYTDSIIDSKGDTITGVTVTVRDIQNNVADIFSDRDGTVKANPFTVGVDGLVQFAAADGSYDIVITGVFNHIAINDTIPIILFDPGNTNLASANVRYLTTVDSPYTMNALDRIVIIDADTGNFIFNFLSANTVAIELSTFRIQRARDDAGVNTVTLAPFAGDTLGLGGSINILPGEWNDFRANGVTDYLVF